jgi:hypothetical protein
MSAPSPHLTSTIWLPVWYGPVLSSRPPLLLLGRVCTTTSIQPAPRLAQGMSPHMIRFRLLVHPRVPLFRRWEAPSAKARRVSLCSRLPTRAGPCVTTATLASFSRPLSPQRRRRARARNFCRRCTTRPGRDRSPAPPAGPPRPRPRPEPKRRPASRQPLPTSLDHRLPHPALGFLCASDKPVEERGKG